MFIWQTLQAFPVRGSQIGWGSFLWVPLFVVGWHEAVIFWTERLRGGSVRRLGGSRIRVGGCDHSGSLAHRRRGLSALYNE